MLCEEGGDGVEGGVGGGSQISLTVMELKNTIPKVQEQRLFAEFIAIIIHGPSSSSSLLKLADYYHITRSMTGSQRRGCQLEGMER